MKGRHYHNWEYISGRGRYDKSYHKCTICSVVNYKPREKLPRTGPGGIVERTPLHLGTWR